MRRPPCKRNGTDCPKRQPGCQDHCPDMRDWRAEKAAENEKKQRESDVNNAVWAGKERLLSESSLQPGSVHHSRKLSVAARPGKRKNPRPIRRKRP